MTNAELITALRHCGNNQECSECPLWGKPPSACMKILLDVTDALEAAEKRIAELEAARMELTTKCRRLQAQMKAVTDCHTFEDGER